MNLASDIAAYNEKLDEQERDIALDLGALISKNLPDAEGKVWHGHPVWFMDGNPIVGYSLKKSGIEMLFWSGQSFKSDALRALGKFKAAALSIPNKEALDPNLITALLEEAKVIQWDYANLPKKRELEKLSDF